MIHTRFRCDTIYTEIIVILRYFTIHTVHTKTNNRFDLNMKSTFQR